MHVRTALVEGPVGAETHTPAHPHGQSAPERTFPQRPERPAIDETDSPHAGRYGLTKTNRHAPCNLTKQNRPVIPTDKNRQKRIEQSVHQPQQTAEAENEPSTRRAVRPARTVTVVLRCPMRGREKRRTLRDIRPPRGRLSAPPPYFDPYLPGRAGRTIRAGRTDRAEQTNQARRTGRISRTARGEFPASRPPCLLIRPPHDSAHPASGIQHRTSASKSGAGIQGPPPVRRSELTAAPNSPRANSNRENEIPQKQPERSAGWEDPRNKRRTRFGRERSDESPAERPPHVLLSGVGPPRTLRAGPEPPYASRHCMPRRPEPQAPAHPVRNENATLRPIRLFRRERGNELFQPSENRRFGIAPGQYERREGSDRSQTPLFRGSLSDSPVRAADTAQLFFAPLLPRIRTAPAFRASRAVRDRLSRDRLPSGKPSAPEVRSESPPRSPAPPLPASRPRPESRVHRPALGFPAAPQKPHARLSPNPRLDATAPLRRYRRSALPPARGTQRNAPAVISRSFSRQRTTRSPSPAPPR